MFVLKIGKTFKLIYVIDLLIAICSTNCNETINIISYVFPYLCVLYLKHNFDVE